MKHTTSTCLALLLPILAAPAARGDAWLAGRDARVAVDYVIGFAFESEIGQPELEEHTLAPPAGLMIDGSSSIDSEYRDQPIHASVRYLAANEYLVFPSAEEVEEIRAAGGTLFSASAFAPATASGGSRTSLALRFELDAPTDYRWEVSNGEGQDDTEAAKLSLQRMHDHDQVDDTLAFHHARGAEVFTGTLHPGLYQLAAESGGNGDRVTSWSYEFVLAAPEPARAAGAAASIAALALLARRRRTAAGAVLLCAAALAPQAARAQPTEIGEAAYQVETYLFPIGTPAPIALERLEPIESANEQDAVDGAVTIYEELGFNPTGSFVSFVEAGVSRYGKTFWGMAGTPPIDTAAYIQGYRGSGASVQIYQSFVKDEEDATLTFTYSYGALSARYGNFDVPAPDGLSLHAQAVWGTDLYVDRYEDGRIPIEWELQYATLFIEDGKWAFEVEAFVSEPIEPVTWQWTCTFCGMDARGTNVAVNLNAPFTRAVDLGAIDPGEEFTVVFTLQVLARNDGWPTSWANAFSQDPLGGDTAVQLASTGLTPTNAPILPVPAPGRGPAGAGALAALAAVRARRSARRCS